jgi:glucose/arabinose dehydrogenase
MASALGSPPGTPEIYVDGVALPVGLQFAPDGRLFFVEVNKGLVRVVENGVLRPEPVATLQVVQEGENGLLGLVLDPHFDVNRYLYVFYTAPDRRGRPVVNKVARLTERNGPGAEVIEILDGIPAARGHNGGRMRFGPDGKLYISTGTSGNDPTVAQNLNSLQGKILRLNPDGSVPADNPIPGSPVYALGLRNAYGMAFHPATGRLFATDNGPNSEPKGYDELNLISPGGNYGWPTAVGATGDARFVDPLWHSGSQQLGLSGLTFYTGSQFPEYRGDLFFCIFNSGLMRRVRLSGPDHNQVEQIEDLQVDCRVDVATGPDGALYIAGINRIYRLGKS